MAKRETVMIRVTPRTNAAINILVGKLQASRPGRRIRQDDAIWELIERTEKDVAQMVEEATPKPGSDEPAE